MKIGFLDSGLGGLTILKEAIYKFKAEYLYMGDNLHSPYGTKSKEEVRDYVKNCVEILIEKGCKIIVIACNTATSVCIHELRNLYPNICFIGTEPAVKPAFLRNKEKKVLVMATTLTLKEEKLKHLIHELNAEKNMTFLAMDKLVEFAEKYEKIEYQLAEGYIREKLNQIDFSEYNSIVLGCTHFPLFEEYFKKNLPENIKVIDSAEGVVNNMVKHAKELGNEAKDLEIHVCLTRKNLAFFNKVNEILEIKKNQFKITEI